jgi:glycosyltransferase involved in cell wall biosynthesis
VAKLGISGVKVLRMHGVRELGRRVAWKLGRWLFAPRPPDRPGSLYSVFRRQLQRLICAVWRDLPLQSFMPERRLQEILDEHSKVAEIIVFAPSIGWDTSLFQRPQQLALALARRNCLVFYTEWYRTNLQIGFYPVGERAYRCSVPADVFQILKAPVALIHTYNTYFLKDLPPSLVVYDYFDDYELHGGDLSKVRRDHRELVSCADIVLVTAKQLSEQVIPQRSDAVLCPNAVDYDHFHFSDDPVSAPDDLQPLLAQGKPIIGYYGALARWFDYELLYTVAQRRADLVFLLIGSDYDGSVRTSRALALPNVHWLGVRRYAELPKYLRCFDIATIPFKLLSITQAASPIKLFEYFAGGKPVVATALRECQSYAGVLVAGDADDFSVKLDEALRLSRDPAYLQLIDRVARENTWDARAQQILGLVASMRSQKCS